MRPGARLAERFDVERLAGSGGMGEVWRARDAMTSGAVAVKVIRNPVDRVGSSAGEGVSWEDRFAREAEVLASLRHPGIVRYVAHGTTEEGDAFLAMEWLEGEDLSQRLARAGLTVAETAALIERLADALAAVHARGIVHRDIKPSNVFLVEGDLARPKLLDFGIARSGAARVATQTGVVMGTPGYMSPEQVRGERAIDARTDVFALGCIAFECLTGRPLFVGQHVLAVLTKILLEDIPRVRAVRADVPPGIDDLVARMLEKERDARLPDGAAVAAALRAMSAPSRSIPAPSRNALTAITDGEQRLVSVIVAKPLDASPVAPDATFSVLGATLPAAGGRVDVVELRARVRPFGARLEVLHDRSLVATLSGRGTANDQAAQAARCALSLRAALDGASIAVATGRGVLGAGWAVGEVIDRVAELSRGREERVGIVLDAVTAGLLDARFDVERTADACELRGEAPQADESRPLLGRPTPCVGRERELSTLDATLAATIGDPAAHAVLVVGAAGMGKSRLRHELVRRARARDEGVEIFVARADPVSAGSAFALLAQIVRSATSAVEGEPLAERREKLRDRVARNVQGSDVDRVAAFLGEACGIPFDDASPQLRAARLDAVLLGDQIRRSFEDWLVGECAARPLLIVLENLQWGDLPSVRLVDAALRACADRPLMVLALARPEVHATFPDVFLERPRTEIRLGELPRRAAERLAKQVLPELDAREIDRLVSEASGNALWLEELLRARAEGAVDVPPTLLAIVHARVERLEPEARRVLRAASVFGHAFWRGGVAALLGDDASSIGDWISTLVARETVVARPSARFAGEEELSFRHALVREAAYAMLTDGDRMLGHRLAAEWLERVGEHDPLVLAEHWERGGEPSRAIDLYRRAAEQALGGSDFEGAIARAERAVACGPNDEQLAALRTLQAEAHKWRGEFAQAETHGREALRAARRGSPVWCAALCELVAAVDRQGKIEDVVQLANELREIDLHDEAHAIAAVRVAIHLVGGGRYDLADHLLRAFDRLATARLDPILDARLHQARALRALFEGVPDLARTHDERAAEAFERIGDVRRATNHRLAAAYGDLQLGEWARAVEGLREVLASATKLGLRGVAATARHNLGLALARRGEFDEARALETEAVDIFHAQRDLRMEGASRMYLADILERSAAFDARDARLAEAERQAASAVELLRVSPPLRAQALATLSRVRLARGEVPGALDAARSGMRLLEELGKLDEGEAPLRLAYAEALEASGDREGARQAIAEARERLLARAGRLGTDAARASYLRNVPEHARTLALAERLGADGARSDP